MALVEVVVVVVVVPVSQSQWMINDLGISMPKPLFREHKFPYQLFYYCNSDKCPWSFWNAKDPFNDKCFRITKGEIT